MRTLDVPQANDLHTVRAIVNAVRRGATTREALVDFTGFSTRHTGYRLHAARVLGFVEFIGDDARLTALGDRLMAARVSSDAERAVFHDAVSRCPVVRVIAPDLLDAMGPTVEALSDRIADRAGLKASTARRRASCLLSWRFQALGLEPSEDAEARAKAIKVKAAKAKAAEAKAKAAEAAKVKAAAAAEAAKAAEAAEATEATDDDAPSSGPPTQPVRLSPPSTANAVTPSP
jgi:cobalamin biosynthesis Mg chelatase CobN